MRTSLLSLLITIFALSSQGREVIILNTGWQFSRDSLFTDYIVVDIPHDFQIDQPWVTPAADERTDNSDAAANTKSRLSARGFKEMGVGWYTLTLKGDSLKFKDKRVLLDFEGIMLVGDVYLNGQYIGGTDYGYVGFEIDITDKLKVGQENLLMVKANTMGEKNSRWYTGGGLFRNVSIITTSKDLYFNRHPLYITTRDNRFVNITAEVTNRLKKDVRMLVSIMAPDGQTVYQKTITLKRHRQTRTWEMRLPEIEIPSPLLWDTETPHLYQVKLSLLREDGSVADETTETFGIRTIEMGPDDGLKLNGKNILLKGYANHHTLGALGAAAYPRAIEKRIQLMKQFGINHIRTSHNPYSREFIRLCDRYGILVVDELYDKWTQQYAGGRIPWQHLWQKDIPEWVKRDRNSPSVILWSLGNELQQISNMPYNDYGVTAYQLQKTLLLRYDSTRLTTVAMHPRYRNWGTDSLPCDLAMKTDIQSYNYRYMYFPGDGRRFPWMTFYQSEASTSNMGPNYFEMDLDKVIGLAYWGAIDYLGESQGWPAKGWSQGVFDISLQPKPKAYLMKSLFTAEPIVHIAIIEDGLSDVMWNGVQTGNQRLSENWNRTSGSTLSLYTYTNCDEVELRLNGHSLGRKINPKDPKQRNQIRWDNIPYQHGRLEAIGYSNNAKTTSHHLETTGKAVRLMAQGDNDHWKADGEDLQHILITAVDTKGRKVWEADEEISVDIEGPARIVAVTNGDITSDELPKGIVHHLWHGSTMVILRAGQTTGTVRLNIRSRYKTVSSTFNLEK